MEFIHHYFLTNILILALINFISAAALIFNLETVSPATTFAIDLLYPRHGLPELGKILIFLLVG